MQPLPIGIQTFKNIREGDFLYVDKTKWIYELVRNPNAVYFLSRPRRFGKSLTLSTLKEIFEGNRELFQGLWIYNADYHWKKYPIIRIDFSKQKAESKEELKQFILEQLDNPFSTLLLFENKEFKNYWFETGTPSFLIDLAKEKDFAISELPILAEEISFSTYEVDELDVIPLLFQTGYLTLKGYDPERLLYTLDYPNFEVKNAFLQQFTRRYTNRVFQESKLYGLIDSLRERDFENFFLVLRSIFANIDYDLHIPAEKYYQTIFYLIFTLIGLRVSAEVKTNIGRIDAVIEDRCGGFSF